MDKEQAKFILQSFRPNGQDAADGDFQEALQLAVEDRDLGEWLSAERAMDAEFASALMDIEISENLRVNILAIMHGVAPEDPESDEEMDQMLYDALTDVNPPEGLRDQILAAMEMEKKGQETQESSKVVKGNFNRKWLRNVTAVAAAVVLGVFLALQMNLGDKPSSLTSYDVQQNAGQLLNDGFSLDVKHSDHTHLTSWLSDQKLPAPTDVEDLPPGLRDLPSIGCKKMVLSGDKEASLICFLTKDKGSIHLVVVGNDMLEDADLPERADVTTSNCYHCPKTSWNVVRWRDENNTYILLAKPEAQEKEELLNYF